MSQQDTLFCGEFRHPIKGARTAVNREGELTAKVLPNNHDFDFESALFSAHMKHLLAFITAYGFGGAWIQHGKPTIYEDPRTGEPHEYPNALLIVPLKSKKEQTALVAALQAINDIYDQTEAGEDFSLNFYNSLKNHSKPKLPSLPAAPFVPSAPAAAAAPAAAPAAARAAPAAAAAAAPAAAPAAKIAGYAAAAAAASAATSASIEDQLAAIEKEMAKLAATKETLTAKRDEAEKQKKIDELLTKLSADQLAEVLEEVKRRRNQATTPTA
jgi:pyruvate/2-oxoglutarate dehydrogenase complex dihydrolipoamide acyltransferase (E2) component